MKMEKDTIPEKSERCGPMTTTVTNPNIDFATINITHLSEKIVGGKVLDK